MIEAGEPAPEFTLADQDGNDVSLSDFRGRTVVLVFYPLDFSAVCTDQLNVYQEVLAELEEQGATLRRASPWTPRSPTRRSGITSALTFPLLADFHPKGEVARQYGVYIEERGHNGRALVMVDPEGNVSWSTCVAQPARDPRREPHL